MTEQYDIRDFFSTESLESIEGVEDFVDVERAFNKLPAREKKIVYLRLSGYTQNEIAEEVRLSDRQIRRILANMSAFDSIMPQD